MARVLVVEDDPAIRRLLALHLESEAHDVFTAEDGEQGLRMAINAPPDLIVSDSRMPRLDGIDMLRGIRSDVRTAAVPFIFLTDGEDSNLRRRSRALQVSDFLTKPFNRASLLEAVSKQTRKRRVRHLDVDQFETPDPDHSETVAMAPDFDTALRDYGETVQLTPESDSTDLDHSATVAMAPEFQAPQPGIEMPSRDPTTRSVHGTVIFFAIRDFTLVAEALGEELQLELVATFQDNVREVVSNSSGWVVKTIEGGFIAMFEDGATNSVHHTERAAKTAVLCVLALHRFGPWIAAKSGKRNIPALAAVAGLHSGLVSVCSLHGGKSGAKSERTIIGDTVNVASRLQAKAGELGWSIVCSDDTLRQAGPRFGRGRDEKIIVKGRKKPLSVAEVTGLRPKPGDNTDGGFYVDVARALKANTRLIDAQNSIRQPAPAAASPLAPAPVQEALFVAPPVAAAPAVDPQSDAPIAVPGYSMQKKIGEGGMAHIYLARHTASGEERVLKLVQLSEEYEGESAKRFVQEYSLLMQVSHRNVARVYQHGHEDGYAYMAMEYFPGGDLRKFLLQPCAPSMAVACLIQIAGGITAVHRTGVVHRDLKPDNIMIRADGSLAIVDFGIAKKVGDAISPTQHGEVVGTPYYLSPEQVQGHPVDHRADIYSLGVLFYEMLTGERAYQAQSVVALMHQHAHSPVPILAEPLQRFQPLLDRMMNKDRDKRLGGASEILDFVTHYQLA